MYFLRLRFRLLHDIVCDVVFLPLVFEWFVLRFEHQFDDSLLVGQQSRVLYRALSVFVRQQLQDGGGEAVVDVPLTALRTKHHLVRASAESSHDVVVHHALDYVGQGRPVTSVPVVHRFGKRFLVGLVRSLALPL